LKEEAVYRVQWRIHFGRGYVPALRLSLSKFHNTQDHVLKHSQSLLDLRISAFRYVTPLAWRTRAEVVQKVGQCQL